MKTIVFFILLASPFLVPTGCAAQLKSHPVSLAGIPDLPYTPAGVLRHFNLQPIPDVTGLQVASVQLEKVLHDEDGDPYSIYARIYFDTLDRPEKIEYEGGPTHHHPFVHTITYDSLGRPLQVRGRAERARKDPDLADYYVDYQYHDQRDEMTVQVDRLSQNPRKARPDAYRSTIDYLFDRSKMVCLKRSCGNDLGIEELISCRRDLLFLDKAGRVIGSQMLKDTVNALDVRYNPHQLDVQYAWDKSGRLVSWGNFEDGYSYTYDGAGRLSSIRWVHQQSRDLRTWTETYHYDDRGLLQRIQHEVMGRGGRDWEIMFHYTMR